MYQFKLGGLYLIYLTILSCLFKAFWNSSINIHEHMTYSVFKHATVTAYENLQILAA